VSNPSESSQVKARATTIQVVGLLLCLVVGSMFMSRATVETETPVAWVGTETVSASSPTPDSTSTPTMIPSPTASHTPTPVSDPTRTPTPSPTSSPQPPTVTPIPSRVPATSPPTRIVIPVIELDALIKEVGWKLVDNNGERHSVWDVADYAVGFHKNSAYPGNVGNTVLSGHHNIRGEVFRDLHLVEPGDDIYLYVGIQGYHYVVKAKYRFREKGVPLEVQQDNARWIQHTDDERLTLVTCWPYSGNSHRIVIVAKPGA